MRPSHTRRIAAALLALAAAAGARPAAAQAVVGTPAPDTARWTQADVRFMTAMIGHHAQAIEMARLAPTHDAGPQIRVLAARIINAQEDEIATMRQWLRDRGQPVPEAHAAHHGAGHQAGHGALMPGMLTEAQMRQLDQARGAEFDRLFLTLMIQHHQGAVTMVRELFGSYGAGQDDTVFKLASDVNVDQETEIARMQKMLAEMVFGGATPP